MSQKKNLRWHAGEVSRQERCERLGQRGLVVWMTGLSGSGKSTIAVGVEKELNALGHTVYRLDGDNIRHGLNADLGFSEEDRAENIRRVAEVASLFQDAGLITLVSFISPMRAMRSSARERIGPDAFFEVFVKADVDTCRQRDTKGLYEKAVKGEIGDFTGVSAPYEEPDNPQLVVDTTRLSVEQSVAAVVQAVRPLIHKES